MLLWIAHIVRTQSIETWSIWYIDEDFLIWIIPSTFLSPKSVYWARTTGFVTSVCLINWCLIHVWVCMLTTWFSTHAFDSDLLIHVWLSLHATWHSSHHSLGSFRLLEFACPDSGVWTVMDILLIKMTQRKRSGSVEHQSGTLSFQVPLLVPRNFLL